MAILTEKAIKQLNRAGVTDMRKHFTAKTVRVKGRISWAHYSGYGVPPEVEIVVDDMSRLEVVN